jgi:hypothetical protein
MRCWRCLAGAIAVAAFVVAGGAGTAQETSPSTILTVDQDRLFVESEFGKSVLAGEAAAAQALEAENSRIEADLIAEEQQLTLRRTGRRSSGLLIQRIIPHRYPFLLVDKVRDIVPNVKAAVGIKNVTFNEPQFQGHFPACRSFRACMIIEAMAQTSGVLVGVSMDLVDKNAWSTSWASMG